MTQANISDHKLHDLANQIAERILSQKHPSADAVDAGAKGQKDDAASLGLPVVEGQKTSCSPGADMEHCATCQGCHVKRCDDVRAFVGLGVERLAGGPGNGRAQGDLASCIDHTLLRPDATREELSQLCREARQYGFASVCVNGCNVGYCARSLQGSPVMTVAVVGFPLGAMTQTAKAFEAREAVRAGADEIDMVVNLGAVRSGDWGQVSADIQAVVHAAKPKPVKVILEAASLNDEEKVAICTLAKAMGAAFVKTSTGFGKGGATVADVTLMRRVVGPDLGVKASGGVRSTDDATRMVAAGADRLGASASVAIVDPRKASCSKADKGYAG